MNPASEDIKDMLEGDSSLGLTLGVNLFIGFEPDTPDAPDSVVTIYDTTSFPPDFALDPGETVYNSAVQIRVRNTSYVTGISLARDIMESLHVRAQTTWNDTLYTVIQATGEPALMAWDGKNRAIIISNFNMKRR